jgi:ribose 5-phosphate isomerase B
MRVHLGCDHAGFHLKQALRDWLDAQGHEVVDHGALELDPADDYPPFCLSAAAAVAGETDSLGIVLGGSGNGEQIAANKVRGVRAALAWNEETAALAREHNDANVLALGARVLTREEAVRMVEVFVTTSFSGESRHTRRIEMLSDYERTGELPPVPGR